MTNLERWNLYLRDAQPPKLYARVGFYYMIAAALQRRVWVGSNEFALYPNLYVVFVTEGGGGKGLVTSPVVSMLSSHKIMDLAGDAEAQAKASGIKTPFDGSDLLQMPNTTKAMEAQLLFPCAPSSCSKAALVREMAHNATRVFIPENGRPGEVYTYQSLHFNLDELTSLIKEGDDETMAFLLEMYTCKPGYRHSVISREQDLIPAGCLSLIAGTTPESVVDLVKRKVLTNGFLSRTWFVYHKSEPRLVWFIPPHDKQQMLARTELEDWLLKLSRVYGELTYSPAAFDAMSRAFESYKDKGVSNNDPILLTYYQRYPIHLQKATMAAHFSRSLTMTLEVEDVQEGIELLRAIEEDMHKSFILGGRNEYLPIAHRIHMMMKNRQGPKKGMMTPREMRICVINNLRSSGEFDTVLELLKLLKLIEFVGVDITSGEHVYKAL